MYSAVHMFLLPYSSVALDQSTSPPPVPLTVDETFLPPTVVPQTLKEGLVEKKGHSVAFLMWPELVFLLSLFSVHECWVLPPVQAIPKSL